MKRSPAQIEASRRNGARSRGPVTPEGKARSSFNAITHGLDSSVIVLRSESEAAFHELLQRTVDQYQPANNIEMSLVHEIAIATWRLNRIVILETAAIDLEVDRLRFAGDPTIVSTDLPTRTHLAVESLTSRSSVLNWYSRHEARLHRVIRDARAQLLALKKPPIAPAQPTPEPAAPAPVEPTTPPVQKRTQDPAPLPRIAAILIACVLSILLTANQQPAPVTDHPQVPTQICRSNPLRIQELSTNSRV